MPDDKTAKVAKPAFDELSSIPTGSELRVLLNSEHISYGEIHNLLKKKGVYVGNTDKSVTVPLLSATLLTPKEFSNLIESSVDRESKPKNKVSELELVTPSSDWVTPLKTKLFTSDFSPHSKIDNIDFTTKPAIVVDGKGKVKIPYEITRRDFSKDWISREIKFSGEILIEQQGQNLKLEFASTHSSRETEAINRMITSRISKILRDSGTTQSDKEKRITFGCFSNVERVKYFKRLTAGAKPMLGLGTVNDIEISRDGNCPALPNDPQIEWLNNSVRRLKIDGERLNDIFLISDEHYYAYYYVLRIDSTFTYSVGTNTGTCRVIFSFSPLSRSDGIKDDAELMFEFVRTSDRSLNSDARKSLQTTLERAIRGLIETEYRKIISERV